ncbi:FAD-dependent monooxygenase [Streptomyces sp. NPDC127117]|uniref:FAD-dependent monooxygenase n=1 Tax=Streptomyces sp. NPDC127117 TaxID=3345368 RepID=UPI00363655A7
MTETRTTGPVTIAGAGPVGLMLACELALAGVPTTVLERRAERGRSSGGMVLHPRSLEALRARGLADRFVDDSTPLWPRTHFGLFYLDLTELPEDHYFIVPQAVTEARLADRATELGVELRRGAEVVGVEQDDDGVTVRLADGTDIRSAYLVACDGPAGRVADAAGFEFEVLAPSYYGVLADVPVFEGKNDQFDVGLFQQGQFGVLPLKPGEIRVMTVEFTGEPQGEDVPVTVEEVRASVERITGKAPDLQDPVWMTRYGYPTRLARHYRHGRVLVAGDAAHAHPPSAGDGLNTGIQDAVNLGWKLAAVAAGRAPESMLDTYHEERHPVGRLACRRAQAQVALMHPLDQVEPLREVMSDLLQLPDVTRHLVRMLTEIRYPMPGDHPLTGTRIPEVTVETADGPKAVSGLMHSGRGVVLNMTGAPVTVPTDQVDVVDAAPNEELDAPTVLIRPDGHVAWAGAPEGMRLAVKTWFG